MPGPRDYSAGARTALANLSGGFCYFPGCNEPITRFVEGHPANNFQIAHIADANPGNRYVEGMSDQERAHFSNLILLCKPHHDLIDKISPSDYPSEVLRKWKGEREGADRGALESLGPITEDDLAEALRDALADQQALEAAVVAAHAARDQDRLQVLRATAAGAALTAWDRICSAYGVDQDQGAGFEGGRPVAHLSPIDLSVWEDIREEYQRLAHPDEFKQAREVFEALAQATVPDPDAPTSSRRFFKRVGDWVEGCHAIVIEIETARGISRGRLPQAIEGYAELVGVDLDALPGSLAGFPQFWIPHPYDHRLAIPADWRELYANGFYDRFNEDDGRAKPRPYIRSWAQPK